MPETSIRIAPELLQACKEAQPSWHSTTSFVNEMIQKGLLSIDTCDTLGIPNDRETQKEKKGREVLPITKKVPNTINKEKEKLKKVRFKFSQDLIPFDLSSFSDSIENFWKVKTGKRTEESFNLLIANLTKIKEKYGSQVVADQLESAIAGGPKGSWSNITLKNYETFGATQKRSWEQETINHPASRVFKVSDSGNPLIEGVI
tara:strand:+ start:1819 stop:2427 length:609 start_codon:yes stop_codon:yes gene_type:complete